MNEINLTAETEKRLAVAREGDDEWEADYYLGLLAVLRDYRKRVLAG